MQTKLCPMLIVASIALSLFAISAGAAPKIITEKVKITASNGANGDSFGTAISLSGDRALIGAKGDSDIDLDSGAAYIFSFTDGTWSQETKLLPSTGYAIGFFGYSVSLSGNLALVGAYGDDALGDESGAAYVFAFDGTSWIQQAKLTASDGVKYDAFGGAVALSGNMALIGAAGADVGGGDAQGAVYVFAFDGVSWTQEAKFTASDGVAGNVFGSTLSLSDNSVLIGATGVEDKGAAYVFAFDGTTWNEQAKLMAADGVTGDSFGVSVSIAGNLALVGASHKDTETGAAYVFAFNGTTWSQQAKLSSPKGKENDYFGSAVALSDTRALVGAAQFYPKPGEVYEFSSNGNTWKSDARLLASDGAALDLFGSSIAVSGTRLLIGAVSADSENDTNTGAVYNFKLPRAR